MVLWQKLIVNQCMKNMTENVRRIFNHRTHLAKVRMIGDLNNKKRGFRPCEVRFNLFLRLIRPRAGARPLHELIIAKNMIEVNLSGRTGGEFIPLIINRQKVSEVICLNCYRRWLAAREVDVPLRDLECPTCGQMGYAIETGETSCAEELIRMAREEVI